MEYLLKCLFITVGKSLERFVMLRDDRGFELFGEWFGMICNDTETDR